MSPFTRAALLSLTVSVLKPKAFYRQLTTKIPYGQDSGLPSLPVSLDLLLHNSQAADEKHLRNMENVIKSKSQRKLTLVMTLASCPLNN